MRVCAMWDGRTGEAAAKSNVREERGGRRWRPLLISMKFQNTRSHLAESAVYHASIKNVHMYHETGED